MKIHRSFAAMLLGCAVFTAAGPAFAELTGARATPRQAHLAAGGDNTVSVTWQVSTTPEHSSGAFSAARQLTDPASGTLLGLSRAMLTATGGGPLLLRETISLDEATVQGWRDQGLRRVVLERTFVDPTSRGSASATVILSLGRSRLQSTRDAAPAELTINSLRLELESGNNAAVTTMGETLRASLVVHYSGSGMLHGRWQIAEPESSGGAPLFRTLALVNTRLSANQQRILPSPPLPTARNGAHLVRFCVTSRDTLGPIAEPELPVDVFGEPLVNPLGDLASEPLGDPQCPDAELTVLAAYHVQGAAGDGVRAIGDISPNRQAVSETSAFSWSPLPQAAVYQLQIFEPAPPREPDSPGEAPEPTFVAGMLVDAATSSTPLSELTRSKLRPGTAYSWRVTAHDERGRIVGSSVEARFHYQPKREQ